MHITDVRIRRVTAGNTKIRALASVVIDGMFVVHELKVVEGVNGLFVAMPSRKGTNGEYTDIAHPITGEGRELVQGAVMEAFQRSELQDAGD